MPPYQRSQAATAAAATVATVAGLLSAWYYLDAGSVLQQRVKSRRVSSRTFATKPSLTAFKTLTEQEATKATYPLATAIETNIPIYDASTFRLDDGRWIERLQDEFYHVLLHGPGVFVIKHFFTDMDTLNETNGAYAAIIERELQEKDGAEGDHFAAAGSNSRIWNSFSKLALQDPLAFIDYYCNPLFVIVSTAWLGPAYRMTSQVNIVKPGGKPQMPHRDYHLGFQTAEQGEQWPKAMQIASQLLTLQGAVAHSDMPLESGPTRFLPFSQMFEEGFLAYRLPEFAEYFHDKWVSLALQKGDAVFFNPALFHAAGENQTTDFERSANLIQVSSAFGKTMETIETVPIVEACWSVMVGKYRHDGMSAEVDALVRAVGEGYPFPTNLDRRPPAPGGMAPESEQDVLRRGLEEKWDQERVVRELAKVKQDSAA
jgi:ectoine hydroxylase-related dioxygenase (phytanoyl-CoA dioxygenase family)